MHFRKNIVTKNLREWLTLAILIFGFIYLTGDTQNSGRSLSADTGTNHVTIDKSADADCESRDVSGHKAPAGESGAWLVAVDVVSLFGKTSRQSDNSNSEFANQKPFTKPKFSTDSKNTLATVSSKLGHQFTLVGEKPSGTS